jgi:hypothetical protein
MSTESWAILGVTKDLNFESHIELAKTIASGRNHLKKIHAVLLGAGLCLASTFIPLIILANCSGYLATMNLNDKKDMARLLGTMTFSLGGILIFVLGQSLSFRQTYIDVDALRISYSFVSWISVILVALCVINSLFSILYMMTTTELWMVFSVLLFLSIAAVLIFVAVLFGICAMTKWMI